MRTLAPLFVALLAAGCTQTFFQPHRVLVDTPERHGVAYRELDFKADDGTPLHAWFLPARGAAQASVLYLHGNAENISTHFASVAWMPAEGFNVLALDYRGYGASQGTPSLAGVQLDIDAAMRALLARSDVEPKRVVLFGQSLGGALAIYYGAHGRYRTSLDAVVTDSAFSDYRSIVREKLAGFFLTWPFQWLPWLTVDDDYSPVAAVGAISPIPLLLLHGDRDPVVPYHHSQELFERAGPPKDLWIVPGAGHTQSLRDDAVRRRLTEFLLRAGRGARSASGPPA
jgi:fermentation-respiration switch protein FrsA (DUF1100 family)